MLWIDILLICLIRNLHTGQQTPKNNIKKQLYKLQINYVDFFTHFPWAYLKIEDWILSKYKLFY